MKKHAALLLTAGLLMGITFAAHLKADEPVAKKEDAAAVIKQALRERRVVTFVYHDHERTVEPHALGKGIEDKPVLLAWQTAGGSNTEPPPGWRVFSLAEISELKTTGVTFAKSRPDFGAQKGGRGLKKIDQEVAPE